VVNQYHTRHGLETERSCCRRDGKRKWHVRKICIFIFT